MGERRVLIASARGASHERHGTPNQDAAAWEPVGDDGGCLVVAVADGHGNERAVRSHLGSRMAVDAAISEGTAFMRGHPAPDDLAALEAAAADLLVPRVMAAWNERVTADVAANPLSSGESAFVRAWRTRRRGRRGLRRDVGGSTRVARGRSC